MAGQRPKSGGWIAPREGGYSSGVNSAAKVVRSATTGRFVQASTTKGRSVIKKPPPPKGRGAASTSTKESQRG